MSSNEKMSYSDSIDSMIAAAEKVRSNGDIAAPVKYTKNGLRDMLTEMLSTFEEKTGLRIEYLSVCRDYPKQWYDKTEAEREKTFPKIKEVTVSFR